jgi:short-subunit dehydrogenase
LAKSVIVTGASSGIGKETVIRLLESGYQVIGLARRYDKLATEQLQPSYKMQSDVSEKHTYVPLEFDIAKPKIFTEVINRIASITNDSQIYGLVNNAGYLEPGAIEDLTMTNLRNQFETNFFGHVDFTKRVLALMVERNKSGGRIINVSSFAGLISLPLIGAYAASKHALEAVSDALRVELWNTDIKVITVNPGVINTGIYDTLKRKTEDILNIKNVNKRRFCRGLYQVSPEI